MTSKESLNDHIKTVEELLSHIKHTINDSTQMIIQDLDAKEFVNKQEERMIITCNKLTAELGSMANIEEIIESIKMILSNISFNEKEEKEEEKEKKLDWDDISKHQKLSEDFIRKFEDKINWEWISARQVLSEAVYQRP